MAMKLPSWLTGHNQLPPGPAEQAEKFSTPNKSYASPTVKEYMDENEISGTDKLDAENIADGLGVLDALSHHVLGEDPQEMQASSPNKTHRLDRFKEALKALNLDQLSGNTLTEKSLSGAKLIKAAIENSNNMPGYEGVQKRMKQAIKDAQEAAQALKYGGEKGGIMNEFIEGNGLPEDKILQIPSHLHKAISLMGRIKEMSTISFARSIEIQSDPNGDQHEYSYTGLDYPQTMDWSQLRPDRILDYVYNQIPILERITERQQKRIIFAIRDFSGSMATDEKNGYVVGLHILLFDLVKSGDAIIITAPFIETLGKIEVIDTTEKAVNWLKNYKEGTGGWTEVGKCIEQAHKMIESGKIKDLVITDDNRPEVLVINDGNDDVDPHKIPRYPTHAIALGVNNSDLKTICEASRGTFNYILLDGM